MNNLSAYIDPVDVSELEEEEIYFMLSYVDDNLFVPQIRTLIFLGRDVAEEKEGLLYFQDVDSYIRLGRYPNSSNGSGEIYICADDQLACFFTLANAVLALKNCVERRANKVIRINHDK